jgi:tetratricopeptide (TPR) repeat protein
MAGPFRSLVVTLAQVALWAVLAYSRPLFGQIVSPEAPPATPKAGTAPGTIPEMEEAVKAFRNRDWDRAAELLEQARKKNKDLPPPHVSSGWLSPDSEQRALAQPALERAVVNDPKDPEAFVILGNMALQERRVTDAELLFLRAQQLLGPFDQSPKWKEILESQTISGLASVAEAREKWPEAQAQLEALLALNLDDKSLVATAMQRLARAHFQQEGAAKALKFLRDAKARDPENVLTPEAALARFCEQYGDHANAVHWMNGALRNAPNDLLTLLVAAQWALETGQLQEAEKNASTALAIARRENTDATAATSARADARLLGAKILRGLVALYKKEYKPAERYFEDAYLQSPTNFAASNNLALALCEEKGADGKPDPAKLNRALQFANANYQAKPRNSEAASTLGWVLYKAGQKDRAEMALRLATSLDYLHPDTAYYLAQVASDNGSMKKEDLKTLLQAALTTKSSFSMRPEAQALLDKIKAETYPAPKVEKEAPLP